MPSLSPSCVAVCAGASTPRELIALRCYDFMAIRYSGYSRLPFLGAYSRIRNDVDRPALTPDGMRPHQVDHHIIYSNFNLRSACLQVSE